MNRINEPHPQDSLRQAAEWRVLGLLFERPCDGWRREVEALGREVLDPEIRAAAECAGREGAEGSYLALLGPGGPVSPREVSYRGMQDPGRILADIEAYYEAFAFHPATDEPPDHLALEAGFLGYLALKVAYAKARGNIEEAEVAAQAAARFREAHLSALAWPVADRLGTSDVRYLALAARALALRAGPRTDTLTAPEHPRQPDLDSPPIQCGEE